tara:strand:- start:14 stop:1069 length:1056 start_codon:yes stop_codon:yes gene_type:complete
MQIGSLFMALGFDVDDKKLDQFSDKIGMLRGGLAGVAGVAAVGAGALTALAFNSVGAAQTLSNISQQSQQTTGDLQALANVAVGTNPFIEWEQALETMNSLAGNLVDVEWGQGAAGSLAMLGVPFESIGNLPDFMDALRVAWRDDSQGLSNGRKIKLFEDVGVPKAFLNMITETEARYKDLFSLPKLNESDLALGVALNKELVDISLKYDIIGKKIGVISNKLIGEEASGILNWFADQNMKIINGIEASVDGRPNPNYPARDVIEKNITPPEIRESVNFGGASPQVMEALAKQWLDVRGTATATTNTTNNINIESTADAKDLTESVFETIEMQQNKSIAGELPNVSQAGIR